MIYRAESKGEAVYHGTDQGFCRCGGLTNKPFYDGTHEKLVLLTANPVSGGNHVDKG
jgi:CDGSH-type Zn-finger protein